ncbi:hypothetical protein [Candidatus Accumulibacter sp. ACC003]|uniref:hypothetical protein n=1 Tax=Candidatus Accumulibacter sp. ACC003 TaxID=2823334 RepID=UPI0025BDA1D9|nr:hypothetical protein [Candidatus Accumulibacter sp. ACC003]
MIKRSLLARRNARQASNLLRLRSATVNVVRLLQGSDGQTDHLQQGAERPSK